MDIGPGDYVECVDAAPRLQLCTDGLRRWLPCSLREGLLYLVGSLAQEMNGEIGVVIHGHPSWAAKKSWNPNRFRLIKRRDESLLKSLLEPTNLEREDA